MALESGLSVPVEAATRSDAEVGRSMQLVVLHGLPASGKLTVARELSRLTQFKLFHNHLTVDLLLPVFEFASAPFAKLREEIWASVMREAFAVRLEGLIFTFTPERSVSEGFLNRLAKEAESAGADVRFVELVCPEHEIENRLASSTRKQFGKLQSAELYRKLRAEGFFSLPNMPVSDLIINTSQLTPQQSAASILDMLKRQASGEPSPSNV
jgi:chloramphenicol 3-O-phosphotransferase